MGWKFPGYLISVGMGSFLTRVDGKSKNYVFILNIRSKCKQAKTKYELSKLCIYNVPYINICTIYQ